MTDTARNARAWERVVGRAFNAVGLSVARTRSLGRQLPVEATNDERCIIERVRPFTMTSDERLWSLLRAVTYIHEQRIAGDIVECGVWRGGSMMAAALQLMEIQDTKRTLWLYDTFAGMTPPTTEDREAVTGITATQLLEQTDVADGNNVWCIAGEDDVRTNMASTGYPTESLRFIRGDVAQTLLESAPHSIALLRLDTDWYASTRAELEVLYPKLVSGGICILDDYGHWQGARQAVDEYFRVNTPRPLMLPIDFSGRIFIKP